MSALGIKEMSKSMVGYRSGGPKYNPGKRPDSRTDDIATDLVYTGLADNGLLSSNPNSGKLYEQSQNYPSKAQGGNI